MSSFNDSAPSSPITIASQMPPPGTGLVRAAEYVRMSTDHQQYSVANQQDAIRRYAQEHHFQVVHTYADEGCSGLNVQGRQGLCALLGDVVTNRTDFNVVLVYDVSRWGRFQDADESAYYEFLCRRAGIRVEYCMEPFRNDGSPMAAVIKSLKRVMAGEYSRELSEKVFLGKCRGVQLGFSQGGSAGYGLRRVMIDATGRRTRTLKVGEHKSLQSDRVIIVPGPTREIRVVRWIFRQVADHGRGFDFIAGSLNDRGVLCQGGSQWSSDKIKHLLSNEKYIGNLVFNRTSVRLKSRLVRNPREQWVRKEGAIKPIIDPELFHKAQRVLSGWTTRISDADALAALKGVLTRHGKLTSALINATPGIPGSVFYENRFGGLARAYALVGYKAARDFSYLEGFVDRFRHIAALRRDIAERLEARGAAVTWPTRDQLEVNGVRVAVKLSRFQLIHGLPRWTIQIQQDPLPTWALIACLEADNTTIREFHLVACPSHSIFLGTQHRRVRARYRATGPDPLLEVVLGRRVPPPDEIVSVWPLDLST